MVYRFECEFGYVLDNLENVYAIKSMIINVVSWFLIKYILPKLKINLKIIIVFLELKSIKFKN